MSKVIEIIALVLGGLSLFSVCFLGFAVAGGKSASEIPVVGSMFEQPAPEPAEDEGEAKSSDPANSAAAPRARRNDRDVIEAGIGVMGAWSLPSPFTQVELKELADELKSKRLAIESRERAILEREQEIGDKLLSINERFEMLENMRLDLEDFEQELRLREEEVKRDEDAQTQRIGQTWMDRASVFAGLSDSLAGEKLLEYEPTEAAQILRSMDQTKAAKILEQIPDQAKFKEYLDAYANLPATTTGP